MLDIYSVVGLRQCILESLYPHLTTTPPQGGAPSRPSVMPALYTGFSQVGGAEIGCRESRRGMPIPALNQRGSESYQNLRGQKTRCFTTPCVSRALLFLQGYQIDFDIKRGPIKYHPI